MLAGAGHPTAVMAGTGRGARLGILIREAEVLERAGPVTTALLDKTGTLTSGRMALVEVAPTTASTPTSCWPVAAGPPSPVPPPPQPAADPRPRTRRPHRPPGATKTTETLSVPDISCDHCQRTIESALGRLPGVQMASVDVAARTVQVTYDETALDQATINATLSEEGYEVARPRSVPP